MRMNVYPAGSYMDSRPFKTSRVYERTLNDPRGHQRQQTGSIKALADARNNLPSGFPAAILVATGNTIDNPRIVLCDDGEQFVLSAIRATATATEGPQYLLMRFMLNDNPITEWFAPVPPRLYVVNATAVANAVFAGSFPGASPLVFNLKFDQIQFARNDNLAGFDLAVQGLIATGDARISAGMIGNI